MAGFIFALQSKEQYDKIISKVMLLVSMTAQVQSLRLWLWYVCIKSINRVRQTNSEGELLMKKIIKIVLTLLFIPLLVFSINNLIVNYSDESLAFVILAVVFFVMHLFAWIAPKTFFKLCWKITNFIPDNFDYDTSFSKLELCDIGILVVANILVTIGIII